MGGLLNVSRSCTIAISRPPASTRAQFTGFLQVPPREVNRAGGTLQPFLASLQPLRYASPPSGSPASLTRGPVGFPERWREGKESYLEGHKLVSYCTINESR